jgi:hypothetical protein
MNHYLKPSWKTGLLLILSVACLAVVPGCLFSPDDDEGCDNPPCNEPPPSPSRSTPRELLTTYFEQAYTSRDSILYAEMLDEEFSFHFLVQDADSLRDLIGQNNYWGRTLDLESTGFMFGSPDVTGITLNISVLSEGNSTDGGCLECKQLETTVTLRVNTIVPGPDPELVLAVDSQQTFYAKKDPADTTLWVLWKQVDKAEEGKQLRLPRELGSL